MAEDKIKRQIAFKLRVGDISSGKPKIEGDRFTHLELDGKNIVRVNLIGNIVEKFESSGEKQYSFTTLDDGSGQIKLKSFGDDVEKLKNFTEGQTVLVIGVLRNFQDETYVSPEIIREQDPKYLLIRKLEIEKSFPKPLTTEQKQEIRALRDEIIDLIKTGAFLFPWSRCHNHSRQRTIRFQPGQEEKGNRRKSGRSETCREEVCDAEGRRCPAAPNRAASGW
ncbi:MAG: OB-fold nucleic acid binding domain-containing protein [Planctomycetes bacterium]|nr:OB-fold nucleic acid binding domain-containing protein [Planctomycetota bacterium]